MINGMLSICISDDNRNLATDTLMNPKSSVSVSRRGFSAATWSPQGGDDVGR